MPLYSLIIIIIIIIIIMWKNSEVKWSKVRHAAPYQATGPIPTFYSLITHFTSVFFHIVTLSFDALTTNVWSLSE
jgi:hypothetical protein